MPNALYFAIHNHQPVGNFDSVINDAFEKAYLPFLRLVKNFPNFKFALHNSGILYEWAEKNRPEFFNLIEELLSQKQLELLGGGFYEPILPAIPETDRRGQILKMSEYLEKRFGRRPNGIWIAERVWEPNLPKTLAEAGIEYAMLDDTHFKYAGYEGALTSGPLITEDEGKTIYVFPISKELRYKIPFGSVEEVKNFLFVENSVEDPEHSRRERSRRENPRGPKQWIYADDGEKFGVWPNTFEHNYANGWLERFLQAVTSDPAQLQIRFFSAVIQNRPSAERIYLPPASYDEMLEWALPPKLQLEYEQVKEKLKNAGEWEKAAPFLRGGFWRNFLVKYPEVNQMHKKMLFTSRKLQGLKDNPGIDQTKWSEAQNLLFKGQCNCPYWHGVFGGAYLNHLRAANYEALIGAQNLIYELENPKPVVLAEETDIDADGGKEIVIETPTIFCVINPNKGGSISELDFKPKKFNLQNTFAGHPEAYHRKLPQTPGSSEKAATIHERIEVKDKDIEKYLPTADQPVYPKWSFVEHFGDAAGFQTPFKAKTESDPKKTLVSLELENPRRIFLQKTVAFDREKPLLTYGYLLRNLKIIEKETFDWVIEFNLNFEAPGSPDRYFKINGQKPARPMLEVDEEVENVTSAELVDEWRKMAAVFRFPVPIRFHRRPIFTVSLSESGAEKIYQGSTLRFGLPVDLNPKQSFAFEFTLELLSL